MIFKLFDTPGVLGPGCAEEGWQDSPYERKVAQETWNKNKMASFHMDCQPVPELTCGNC
jgi:hypothetical protein